MPTKWLQERPSGSKNDPVIGFEGPGVETSRESLVRYCHTTSASTAHALRIVLLTVPRVGRSCELFPDGFDLHLQQFNPTTRWATKVSLTPDSGVLRNQIAPENL